MRFKGKLIHACRRINKQVFLVPHVGLASSYVGDDQVILIMGIVSIMKDANKIEGTL
jgi:hypothetical protein